MKLIVTMPPYAPYIDEVLRHPAVEGIRLNTVMPVIEPLDQLVGRLDAACKSRGKQLWVDLKCRQLRVKSYGVPPFTEIELTHKIKLKTPATAYFSGGKEYATVVGVDGNRLIMLEGPKRVVGPGESVNIPDSSLEIDGYMTGLDKDYVKAGNAVGFHNYMLSYVERKRDIDELLAIDPKAKVVAKIESINGLDYVKNSYQSPVRLMAARGDLYLEVKMPHQIIPALESILAKDKDAIVASRIFSSLAYSPEPDCQDIGDVDSLMRMGYTTFMLGDEVCQERDSVMNAIGLFAAMAQEAEQSKSTVK